ncbi:DUF6415 family natural product biosynthesis protein [Streptomyces sp. 35G-GA-8]|uniref:DUF6415 family natural product biosynthesis protein n=1 Tax=Streptomyces sp. 35G-GA-8 TaxID=2939434 RepID=UPI00201FA69D|nr:DUF6415 family natural product biosynthesis protein [Streptomyces sp. 35G-GA-8]MCL7376996.1 DUF6415 family natural product biosynthesis protein [Streptomyces sp. 35G-GA-8]
MAALTRDVPDKVEILPLVETALGWDLQSQSLPELGEALDLVTQFTVYGRVVADDLRTLCFSIPADSDAGRTAQAALSESTRRPHLPPPTATQPAAAQRAQHLARLIKALVRATGQVNEAQAEGPKPQHTTTKGT